MSDETLKLPDVTSVEVLSPKPGDVLVCTVKGRVKQEMKEYLISTLKERFNIQNKILVVEDDLGFSVISKE